jgi:hypothetical protein
MFESTMHQQGVKIPGMGLIVVCHESPLLVLNPQICLVYQVYWKRELCPSSPVLFPIRKELKKELKKELERKH